MDSQENTLQQGLQAEKQQETVAAAEVENTENVVVEVNLVFAWHLFALSQFLYSFKYLL